MKLYVALSKTGGLLMYGFFFKAENLEGAIYMATERLRFNQDEISVCEVTLQEFFDCLPTMFEVNNV